MLDHLKLEVFLLFVNEYLLDYQEVIKLSECFKLGLDLVKVYIVVARFHHHIVGLKELVDFSLG